MEMDIQILLPGEQVMPLPKSSKKNKNKNKPNGFISFANAQRKTLGSQFEIRGQDHLVQLCDPMWRRLTPNEKKIWNTRAKEEHARAQSGNKRNGVRLDNASTRMDCNGKVIAERLNAERSTEQRRHRERQFVSGELARCDEVVDLTFCIIDCLTAIDYTDGECVPCEIGVVKCSIREGLMGSYHFFPDPGALRPGFIAEAQIRTDTVHEVPYEGFHLASSQYEQDAEQLLQLIKGHAHTPKQPLLFCRSSEYKYVQSCLDWLSYRVNTHFSLQVMELESFCVDLVTFTNNEPPTFAQIRRLLFETRYDFQAKTRCEFHSLTDKANCAIGNVRKYYFFLSELLYDYYEFELKEGLHYPRGFKRPKAAGSSVCSRSEYDFDDGTSVRSDAFSVSSFVQQRTGNAQQRTPYADDAQQRTQYEAPCAGNVRQIDEGSVNSFSSRGRGRSPSLYSAAPSEGLSQMSIHSDTLYGATVPRRPVVSKCDNGLTYDTNKGSNKSQNSFTQPISVTPPPKVNSFSQEVRSQSPARSIGRGSSPVCGAPGIGYTAAPPGFAPLSRPGVAPLSPSRPCVAPLSRPCVAPLSRPGVAPLSPSRVGSTSLGRGRGRGITVNTELPRKPHSSNPKKDKF